MKLPQLVLAWIHKQNYIWFLQLSIIELERTEELDVSSVILVEVGHAIVEEHGTLQLLGQRERRAAPCCRERAIGQVIVPELDLLAINSGNDQRDPQTDTDHSFT